MRQFGLINKTWLCFIWVRVNNPWFSPCDSVPS